MDSEQYNSVVQLVHHFYSTRNFGKFVRFVILALARVDMQLSALT